MKNIHVIPTEQPSRLWVNNLLQGKLELSEEILIGSNTAQHIYIRSDDEFKEGDWYITQDGKPKRELFNLKRKGRVILTTDPTLIADGVQAVDDDFLKWFVKNPTCEYVNIEKEKLKSVYNPNYKDFTQELDGVYLTTNETTLQPNETLVEDNVILYSIIIPKDEPKQDHFQEMNDFMIGKETLKEAADKYFPSAEKIGGETYTAYKGFIEGAKWQAEKNELRLKHKKALLDNCEKCLEMRIKQAEKMYNEEEVYNILLNYQSNYPYANNEIGLKKWFEKFKKK